MLSLVDDTLYEEGEELRLVLGNPRSESQFGGSVGAPKETLVKIKDTADSKYKKRAEPIPVWVGISINYDGGVNNPAAALFLISLLCLRAHHPFYRDKVQRQRTERGRRRGDCQDPGSTSGRHIKGVGGACSH